MAEVSQVELEKTFLAKFVPKEIKTAEPLILIDVYFPVSAKHPVLRLRRKGSEYVLTKKSPVKNGDASVQRETTIPLTKEEYDSFGNVPGKRVAKKRYAVILDGIPAEIDIFTEDLSGLVVIDFEFQTSQKKREFEPPDCCLADITQEEFVAGGMLAGKSYSDILKKLKSFGYKALN